MVSPVRSGAYVGNSPKQIEEMLEAIGIKSIDELFSDIPEDLRLDKPLELAGPYTERGLSQFFDDMASKNLSLNETTSFLAGGLAYHYVPAAVDELLRRGEIYTSYTPYQAEISQGILQMIFEYQAMISEITGMDMCNASAYDWDTSLGEATLMACRISKKSTLLLPDTVPERRKEVLASYVEGVGINIVYIPHNKETGQIELETVISMLAEHENDLAALYVEVPNYFGVIEENLEKMSEIVHQYKKAQFIVGIYPPSLGLLEAPGNYGADIVIGEGQTIGNGLNYGGPFLGIFAAKFNRDTKRNMIGRLISKTTEKDSDREAYTITLQTREQHIRREKATSNICSNQSLTAISSAIYLALLGPKGLEEISYNIYNAAHYMAKEIAEIDGIQSPVHSGPFFHEFAIDLTTSKTSEEFDVFMVDRKILAGIPLEAEEGHIRRLIGAHEFTCKESVEKLLNALYAFMEAA